MPITISTYSTDSHEQVGGGYWTVERYYDAQGHEISMFGPYLWDGVTDRDVLMAGRAAKLSELLAQAEIDALLG